MAGPVVATGEEESGEEALPPKPEVRQGKFVFPGGAMYEGEYMVLDGVMVRHGKGTHVDGRETYIGQWQHDAMHGEGEIVFGSDATYRGSFVGNKFDGHGHYFWDDGATYEGSWRENKMHGRGCYKDSNKSRWQGEFFNGMYDTGRSMIALR